MKYVKTGIFELPGISFDKTEMSDELRDQMKSWAEETQCGMYLTDRLWSFMDEGERDWFLLRWSDAIPKTEA